MISATGQMSFFRGDLRLVLVNNRNRSAVILVNMGFDFLRVGCMGLRSKIRSQISTNHALSQGQKPDTNSRCHRAPYFLPMRDTL
jgi:hypothetical protein